MAKTIEQIISNQAQHVERSKMGFHAACEAGNGALAAFNLDQGFRAQLMQGLIRWRSGPADPVNDLKEAVQQISQGIKRLGKIGVPEGTTSVPVELAGIVSFLVKIPFTSEATTSLLSDRLLDVVLVDGLRGGWNDAAWQLGMTTLQKLKGSGLCVETYSTYAQLFRNPKSDMDLLIDKAAKLFDRRAKDSFYAGGFMIEGGGLCNTLTVDFRLAAIMKYIGYSHHICHEWRWS